MRRDIGTDDPRVKVRPGKGSRPRTKMRPDFSRAPIAQVVGVDRGRYRLLLDDGTLVTAVKARELGRGAVVVGDRVRVTGDVSGRKDTLARLVKIEERASQLRRSPEDGEGRERVVVANADQLAIVTALAQPEPKTGMIDRCLVAAYDAGMTPILVLTKADLADPTQLLAAYEPLGVAAYVTRLGEGASKPVGPDAPAPSEARPDAAPAGTSPADAAQASPAEAAQASSTGTAHASPVGASPSSLADLRAALTGHETVLVGHSGVGKSTLINALIPRAERATGYVNEVTGKGRHTSTSAVSLALPEGGRIIDTPGVRGFGLAHVSTERVLRGFVDLFDICRDCPRGCTHVETEPECALTQASEPTTRERVTSFRRLLAARTSDWSQ